MAQIIEFPGFEGDTVDVRLITKGTDTIVHTTSSVTGKTNDATLFRATDLSDGLSGIYRVSAVDSTSGAVKYAGWVDLSGVASAEHICGEYHSILLLQGKPLKNRPLTNFDFTMVDSTDHVTLEPALTVAVTIRKDNGSFAAIDGSVTNVGGGLYAIDLTATEMNADKITLKMTATGADTQFITLLTQPA